MGIKLILWILSILRGVYGVMGLLYFRLFWSAGISGVNHDTLDQIPYSKEYHRDWIN